MSRNFNELLRAKWAEGKFVCVGLDSDRKRLPAYVQGMASPVSRIITFNRAIVRSTKDVVCAYKPNYAFYSWGLDGLKALEETIQMILMEAPDVPIILDAKRGDIDSTNEGYAEEAFEWFKADAVTIHPYLGREANTPFLKRTDKGIFVLCRTSNSGSGEFQNGFSTLENTFLYEDVAERVTDDWNTRGNCGLVVGATFPDEIRAVRALSGDMPFLIPGIGEQGGDLVKTVAGAKNSRNMGMIINASRSIIFASSGEDFAEAARAETLKLHRAVQGCLKT